MAEIHVQTKKHNTSSLWIWILVGLLIIAVVVYLIVRNNNTDDKETINRNTTSYNQLPNHIAEIGNTVYGTVVT